MCQVIVNMLSGNDAKIKLSPLINSFETGSKKSDKDSKNKISEKPPAGPQNQATVIRNEPVATTVTMQTNSSRGQGKSSGESSGETI